LRFVAVAAREQRVQSRVEHEYCIVFDLSE
jgi:hypothetical protein